MFGMSQHPPYIIEAIVCDTVTKGKFGDFMLTGNLIFCFFLLYVSETRRPPWLDPDPHPPDLENARKALFYEHNPNYPQFPDQVRATRLGLCTRPPHRRSHTAPVYMHTEKATMSKVRNNFRHFNMLGMDVTVRGRG